MTVTRENIKKIETKELVNLYNQLTGKTIKKFADRAAAERQTLKVLDEVGLPPVEAKKETVAKTTTLGKRDTYESKVIKVLIPENNKRSASRAHAKFGVLLKHDGKTIKELKAQEGKHPHLDVEAGWPATELRWAIRFSLVKLVNA